ncbi:MAG: hypothetical protein WCA81_14795 [Rhizomicrobium sp.]
MFRLPKAVLPQWRYWPGVALALLFALAIAGFFLAPSLVVHPVTPSGDATTYKKANDWIGDCLTSAAFWTAIFTGILTWSTIGLWRQTERLAEGAKDQSDKMRESIDLARDEFTSTHRPRFKVRKITFSQLTTGFPISGHCDVANVGDMPGELIEYCVEVVCGTPGERYEYWIPKPKDIRQFNTPLAVGQSGTIWFTNRTDLIQPINDGIQNRSMAVYVFGYVGYIDAAKLRRNTGFLRCYDASFARFRTINDPDYEYED